jgi:hypothetical protein
VCNSVLLTSVLIRVEHTRQDLAAELPRVHPLVWFCSGLLIAYLSIGSFWSVYPGISPHLVGLSLGLSVLALTLCNRDRPDTLRANWTLGIVCFSMLTHGLWWQWYWVDIAGWLDEQIRSRLITRGYVWYLLHHSGGGIFAGLTLASVLLAFPIGWITGSRCARTCALIAGPSSYWWFETGVLSFPLRCRIDVLDLLGRDLTSPAIVFYCAITVPMLVLAIRSMPSKPIDGSRCHCCGYSLNGIEHTRICPECGQAKGA